MSRICRIEAPCKINLHLEVGERRPDGYHDISSIFLCLGFGDSLVLEEYPDSGPPELLVQNGGNTDGRTDNNAATGNSDYAADTAAALTALPPERNLAYRAAVLFREQSGYDRRLRITLVKRVPAGGGLGGGSSDAAAVLRALNALAGTAYAPETLAALATKLGSDVPFFLTGGAALVTGRGDRLQPLALPDTARDLRVVIITPGFPSSTAEAFARLDAWREAVPQEAASGRRITTDHTDHTDTHLDSEARSEMTHKPHKVPGTDSEAGSEMTHKAHKVPGTDPAPDPAGRNIIAQSHEASKIPAPTLRALCTLAPLREIFADAGPAGLESRAAPAHWPFRNDFLPVLRDDPERGAAYGAMMEDLANAGAEFAGLSGAGSSCFGVFRGEAAAMAAKRALARRWPFVRTTFFLASLPGPMIQ